MEGDAKVRETLKKYDVITKVLSVFAAVILWIYVMNNINPVQTMSYNGFSVKLQGEEEILNAYSLSVISGSDISVSIKISGTRNQLISMKTAEVKVVADISGLTEPGTYDVPYTVQLPNSLLTVESKSPDTIPITVDKIISKSVKIETEVKGSASSEYQYREPELSDSTLTISGPAEEVNQIDHALVVITADRLTANLKQDYDIFLVDEDGKEVRSPNITKSISAVTVLLPVDQKKTLSLQANVTYTDEITEDMVDLKFSPKTVTVYGSASKLAELKTLTVAEIDLAKHQNGDEIPFEIELPDGVSLADSSSQKGTITISIEQEETKEFDVSNVQIQDSAVEAERKATTVKTNSISVTVKGRQSALDALKESDITGTIALDSSSLTAGLYKLPVEFALPSDMQASIQGEYTAEVEVDAS